MKGDSVSLLHATTTISFSNVHVSFVYSNQRYLLIVKLDGILISF